MSSAPTSAALYSGEKWAEKELVDIEKGWQRDPNGLNTHLQVMWDDIIGEPEGLQSLDCTWDCSKFCFEKTLGCCYIVMTMIYAPIFACCAGCNFACLGFQHIWGNGPLLRIWKINFAFVRKLCQICTSATCAPLCETLGLIFSKAKVRTQKLDKHTDDDDVEQIFVT